MSVIVKEDGETIIVRKDRVIWLVDYDIPTWRRKSFYRHLKNAIARYLMSDTRDTIKTLREAWDVAMEKGVYVKSTASVIRTTDRKLAELIYKIATTYGTANMYMAIEV